MKIPEKNTEKVVRRNNMLNLFLLVCRFKIFLLLAFAAYGLTSCTSGSPNYQGSSENTTGVVIENASAEGDIWFGSELPGLSNVQLLILKNKSVGTAEIHLDTLTLSQSSEGTASDPNQSTSNLLNFYPTSPWGDSSTLCGDHALIADEVCYIFIRFTASDTPNLNYQDTQFSIKTTVDDSNGNKIEKIVTSNIRTRTSQFGSGSDGSLELSNGTINPLELKRPYVQSKMLFAFDEARVIHDVLGPGGESLSRVKTYSSGNFSIDDEIMFYVSSAHFDSSCAHADLIGNFHFARIVQNNLSTNELDFTPPLDTQKWKPVNASDDGSGTPSYLPPGTENTFCNIQIIRVANFYDLAITDASLLVPQYINDYSRQIFSEPKRLGNIYNRTGGVLPFRVKGKFSLKNSIIDGVGSGFNGGRRYSKSLVDVNQVPFGLGGSIFGWTSVYDNATLHDVIFPSFHTGGDSASAPSAGSHLGRGGFANSTLTSQNYFGRPSTNLPTIQSKPINDFDISKNHRFYLGSGGGYTNTDEFNNTSESVNGVYPGSGHNGGGAVLIFANELDSSQSQIDVSGAHNTQPDEYATYIKGEINKNAANIDFSDGNAEAAILAITTEATFQITGGTANFKPLSDLNFQDFNYTNSLNSTIRVTASSLAFKFFIDSANYYLGYTSKEIPVLNLNTKVSEAHTTINITDATFWLEHEVTKNWHKRASGAGGSIWLHTNKIKNSDLDLIAEGGGADVNAAREDDNLPEVVHFGGGGGNIHLNICGSPDSSNGIPRTNAAGGRTDHLRANLDAGSFNYAQGAENNNSDNESSYWGTGGLVSYQFGHTECIDPVEQKILTKEISPFAITYRSINASSGSLSNPISIRFDDIVSAGTTINVLLGCKNSETVNAYIEFKIPDSELEDKNIINASLSLSAIGQSRWNDKYISGKRRSDKMEKMSIADSLKIRALKTFQSAYTSDFSLRSNQLLSETLFTIESSSDLFTFDVLKWVNENYYDPDLNIQTHRLIWPKDGPITEPNLLPLIKKISAYEEGGITNPFQKDANLGFGLGRSPYILNNGAGTFLSLGCDNLHNTFYSILPMGVYFKVSPGDYPKLRIQYSDR